jgi:lysophospholipase L1-like esterase
MDFGKAQSVAGSRGKALAASVLLLALNLAAIAAEEMPGPQRPPPSVAPSATTPSSADQASSTPGSMPLSAQPGVPPLVEGRMPSLSPACEVPATDIAAPAPLANVTSLLQKSQIVRILAIGSSSTAGTGASARVKSYPSQLGMILEKAIKGIDVEITNRGVGGEVAQMTADRIRSEVTLSKPDLVLWQLGTNDALARVSPEDFEATVRTTVRWLRANGIDVALVGLQYTPRFARDANYFAIRAALQRIAAEENILYVRRYDAMQFISQRRANLQLMSSDNFHLNDLGYQCMAEHVAQAVIASLYAKKVRPAAN